MTSQVHHYSVAIPGNPAAGVPSISGTFGRITVILGSNGTGKSRVLRELRQLGQTFGNRSPVYIEGGRVINIPPAITYDHSSFNEFGTLLKAQTTFRSRRLATLPSRTRDAFFLLERRGQQLKITHSDAVTEWLTQGSKDPCPMIGEDPLDSLFRMFSEVFPEIKLTVETDNKQILCRKNGGAPYQTSELSDGERQALFILADIALTAEPLSLIVADEPELNLNPLLANRLWETIEGRLPEAVFIYGTHSIGFAMRPSIDTIVALKGGGRPALQLQSVHDLDRVEAKEFLGAIPAILSATVAVVVEGDEDSFDAPFYRWVLDRSDVAVVPIGGSQDVVAATRRTGAWRKLSSDIRMAGVIDRDFRVNPPLSSASDPCVVLPYHEAESYLAHPTIACRLAKALGTVAQAPEESEIAALIASHFETNLYRIALLRTSSRALVRLNVSLESATLKSQTSEQELRLALRAAANAEALKAEGYVGADATLKIFDEELAVCRRALETKDIESMLVLAPGKELLARVAPKTGCKDSAAYARATYKHIAAASVPKIIELRSQILAALGA